MHARPGWLPDELATAGRENLDAAHVGRYDRKMDAGGPAEVELLRRYGLDADALVVDLGAGTGQFTLAAAAAAGRVVAVDISPVMLEALRANLAASARTNVEVVRAGFLTYEHEGAPADVVYSRYALHHLPDFWKAVALERTRRILRPGGVLRLVDVAYRFEPHEAPERLERWCAVGVAERSVAHDWTRGELEEHARDEHSTFTWLLEPMLERAGFTIEDATYDDVTFDARYIARAR